MFLEHVNVILTCIFTGNPPPSISWEREGSADLPAQFRRDISTITTTDDTITLHTVNSALIIIGVLYADEGRYRCVASNTLTGGVERSVSSEYARLTYIHPCSYSICQNGGTCRRDGSAFTCLCPTDFSGQLCMTGTAGTLTLYHGKYTVNGLSFTMVRGVAVLNLGGVEAGHFIDCVTSESSNRNLRWTKDEGSRRFRMEAVIYSYQGMIIRALRLELTPAPRIGPPFGYGDVGGYTCRNIVTGERASIHFSGNATAVIPVQAFVEVILGSTAELNIYAEGDPPLASHEIEWKRSDGTQVLNDNRVFLHDSNYRLVIRNVTLQDSGVYWIEIVRESAPASTTIDLDVHVGVKVLSSPASAVVLEHVNVTFTCMFSGNPLPSISWEREGLADLPVQTRRDIEATSVTNDTFTFYTVTSVLTIMGALSEDEGRYQCIATNRLTNGVESSASSAFAELTVTHKYAITATVNTTGSTVAGSEFILNCVISKAIAISGLTTAMWLNLVDDVEAIPVTSGNSITIATFNTTDDEAVSVLTFNPLRTSHDGTYRCSGSMTSPAVDFDIRDVTRDINIGVQIPPPVVSLSVPSGSLVAGGVEDILLTCSAMVNSTVVDLDVQDIHYVFTWQDRNGQDIVSGDRTIISSPLPFVSSSSLTLSPLSTTDTNFTCIVTVSEFQNRVIASEPGSAVTSVDVVVPNDLVVTVHSSGPSTAGITLTLICNVNLQQALIATPIIEWVGPDGLIIMDNTIVTVSESAMSVMFLPLHTSHGGEYMCVANITIPHFTITSSSAYNITVQIPPPTLVITGTPVDMGFHSGLNLTFTGRAEFDPAVDTPLLVNGGWSKTMPFSDLTSDGRVGVLEPMLLEEEPAVYVSSLTVDSLDAARKDSGDYTLSLTISSQPFTTGTSITTTRTITVLSFQPQTVSVEGGVATSGDDITLICNVSRLSTLDPSTLLEVMWLDVDGNIITMSSDDTNLRVVSDVTYTTDTNTQSTLTFPLLTTSQGGVYSCAVNMTIPDIVMDHQVISTAPVRVTIPPAVSVSLQPNRTQPLYAGTAVTLVCTVTVDLALVDTDIMADFNIVSNEELLTSNAEQFNASTFQGEAQINLLVPSDNNTLYLCTSTILPVDSTSSVDQFTNPPVNYILPVADLPPPNITLAPQTLITAGSLLTLTCTAIVVEYLVISPLLQWLTADGSLTTDNPVAMETEVAGEVSTRTLSFTPVLTSHGGQYNCMASLNITGVPLTQSVDRVNVTVQIPSPNVSTSLLQPSIRGTVVSLQGLAILAPDVDTEVSVLGVWTLQDSIENLTSSQATSPPREHNTTHTIASLSEGGVYVFTVVVTSSAPTSTFVEGITASAELEVTLQPYPALEIVRSTESSGRCVHGAGGNEMATLTGTVSLLPNTASDHTLKYTWKTPQGQDITTSSVNLVVNGNTLQVGDLGNNQGDYVLTACLSIPSSDLEICSSATYSISSAVTVPMDEDSDLDTRVESARAAVPQTSNSHHKTPIITIIIGGCAVFTVMVIAATVIFVMGVVVYCHYRPTRDLRQGPKTATSQLSEVHGIGGPLYEAVERRNHPADESKDSFTLNRTSVLRIHM